jgi:hypothetical protein
MVSIVNKDKCIILQELWYVYIYGDARFNFELLSTLAQNFKFHVCNSVVIPLFFWFWLLFKWSKYIEKHIKIKRNHKSLILIHGCAINLTLQL